jgi:hypothetical protein
MPGETVEIERKSAAGDKREQQILKKQIQGRPVAAFSGRCRMNNW